MRLFEGGAAVNSSYMGPGSQFDAPAGASITRKRQQSSYADNRAQEQALIAREIAKYPSVAESIVLQNRWRTGVDPYMMESRMDEASKLRQLENEMWWEMDQFLFHYRGHFEEVVANEMNNLDFFNGYQWSDEETRRLQKRKLIPHVSNFMSRWARTLVGEERGAVTTPNFSVDDPAFKPRADLYNQVLPRIYRQNEWEHRSGDAFFNTTVLGRSFTSVRLDPYDPLGSVLMLNHDPKQFMYDIENAQDGTLDGCNYLARVVLRDLEELIHIYPEREAELRRYEMQDFAYANLLGWTLSQPKVAPTTHKRLVRLPSRFLNNTNFRQRRSVWMIEFYRRYGVGAYAVFDGNGLTDHDFARADQAAYFYRNLRDAYQYKSIRETGKPCVDLVASPREVTRRVVAQELWCGRKLLDFNTVRGDRWAYTPCHNEFHMGEWRGFFQDDKANQQIRNRMLVWWDIYLGNVKPKVFYHDKLFPKGSTQAEREEWVRDPLKHIVGGTWPLDIPVNGGLVVHSDGIRDTGTAEVIYKTINEASNFANGGLNMIGDAEFSGQSDRLRRGLQVSAQTSTVSIFKDWERAETRHAENAAHTTQFLHPAKLLSYANPTDRERFAGLVMDGEHTIEMGELAMEITEVLAGPSKRDRQNAMLAELVQQHPENSQEEKLILLERSDLPQSTIDRIINAREQQAEAQGAVSEEERKLEEYDTIMKWEVAKQRNAIAEFDSQTKRNPPVGYNIVSKIGSPGPDAMTAINEQHGIITTPEALAGSQAKELLTQQAADNLRQEEFIKRDLPHQRALAKLGKAPTNAKRKRSEGTASPKDASARKRKGAEA